MSLKLFSIYNTISFGGKQRFKKMGISSMVESLYSEVGNRPKNQEPKNP